MELERLDDALGLEKGTLRELNPELRFGGTPNGPYDLKVPAAKQELVAAQIATLPEWKRPTPQYLTYRVRSGDTLALIARRYGTTVASLMQANGLVRTGKLRVGQRLRIPARPSAGRR